MQTHTLGLALFFAFAATLPSAATESEPATLESGTRVRVTLRNGSFLIGRLLSLDESRLRLQAEKESIVTSAERTGVTKIETSLGKRSRGRGALKGALIAVGIIAATCSLSAFEDSDSFYSQSDWLKLCAVAAPVFAGIGAAIGAGTAGTERWRAIPTEGIRVGLIAGPGRGVGLRVSVGF